MNENIFEKIREDNESPSCDEVSFELLQGRFEARKGAVFDIPRLRTGESDDVGVEDNESHITILP